MNNQNDRGSHRSRPADNFLPQGEGRLTRVVVATQAAREPRLYLCTCVGATSSRNALSPGEGDCPDIDAHAYWRRDRSGASPLWAASLGETYTTTS